MTMANELLNHAISRRQAIGAGLGVLASFGLAACGGSSESATTEAATTAATTEEEVVGFDTDAYDAIIEAGPVADDATVAASTWASAIKEAGVLKVGGVQTSPLFSLLDETDGKVRGFDAGLSQLLSHYILGEVNNEITQVTSDTRESLLQNNQVDAVFATYSITDKRKEVISFAGPYYSTQQGILVTADNTDINSVEDLAGKNLAIQSSSTAEAMVDEYFAEATIQIFKTDEEARQALTQGRVDAYVIDSNIQLNAMVRNPGKFRIAGDFFGPNDLYGIGVPKDSDAVAFVNAFLQQVEDEGLWSELWKVCIGDRTDIDTVPEPPAIEA